jgi:hypothetical protein
MLIGEPYDWEEPGHDCRAELMTLVTDLACSITEELTSDVDQPDSWWADPRTALDTLTPSSTSSTPPAKRATDYRWS